MSLSRDVCLPNLLRRICPIGLTLDTAATNWPTRQFVNVSYVFLPPPYMSTSCVLLSFAFVTEESLLGRRVQQYGVVCRAVVLKRWIADLYTYQPLACVPVHVPAVPPLRGTCLCACLWSHPGSVRDLYPTFFCDQAVLLPC